MTSRRSFFRRVAALAVALPFAPQLLAKISAPTPAPLNIYQLCYDLQRSRKASDTIDFFTDQTTADQLRKAMARYYWKESYRAERIARRQEAA